jgi:hypothetical protein
MTENAGGTPVARRGDDEFEARLFAMLEAGDAHFPKAALRPALEDAPRTSLLEWLRRHLRLGFPRVFLSAAAAYALALVVSAPVYLALFPRAEDEAARVSAPANVAPAPPAVSSAPRLELGSGPTRASGPGHALRLAPGDPFVVLSFLVPIRSGTGVSYAATLEDASGRVIVAQQPVQSVDTLGNFVLVCRSDLFSSGEYRLTILETSPARLSSPAAPYRFSFHVSRAQH